MGEILTLETHRRLRRHRATGKKSRSYDEHHEQERGLVIAVAIIFGTASVVFVLVGLGLLKTYELLSGYYF